MPLPSVLTLTASANAAQAQVASMPADVQAKWNAATSPQAAQAAQAAGAQAAAGLIANGYDSSKSSDNQALIQTVAGAAAFIPPPGVFSGAIDILDAFGEEVVAPLLEKLGLQKKPGCEHSGADVTPGDVLSRMQGLGAVVTPGTFSALIYPALAYYGAEALNCRPSIPPSYVLAGCIAMWNALASGPMVAYTDANAASAFNPTAYYGWGGTPFGASVGTTPPNLAGVFQANSAPPALVLAGALPGLVMRAGPLAPTAAPPRAGLGAAFGWIAGTALVIVLGVAGAVALDAHFGRRGIARGDRF